MFCPKCAAILVCQGDELTCIAGDMGLSRNVENILIERYGSHTPSPTKNKEEPGRFPWFCPGCGVLLNSEMVCPECHISLKDLQFQLVEIHPHKDW